MKYFPDRVSHNDLLRAMALRIVGREQRKTDFAVLEDFHGDNLAA